MLRRTLLSACAGPMLASICARASARSADAFGAGDSVTIALMPYSGNERRLFEEWIARFNAERPALQARAVSTAPEAYKATLQSRLASHDAQADVYYWFAGTRLRELAAQGFIAPLDELWASAGLREAFGEAVEAAVSWNGRPYAVPLNYYQWGFYYRKSVFERMRFDVPATWDDFDKLAKQALAAGIAPTTLGVGDPWASAAWFDFFDLRLNGLDFHRALTAGSVPFTDRRVKEVLAAWQRVRDQRWYLAEALPLTWREAAPYLLHGRAATYLMGNFFESALPDELRSDIGFFPFPRMRPDMPDFEEGPTDVLMLGTRSGRSAAAREFLRWSCQPAIQQSLSGPYGKLAAHRGVPLPTDPLTRSGSQLLRQAAGYAQYFDRDCPGALAAECLGVFNAFVSGHDDAVAAAQSMEAARRRWVARA